MNNNDSNNFENNVVVESPPKISFYLRSEFRRIVWKYVELSKEGKFSSVVEKYVEKNNEEIFAANNAFSTSDENGEEYSDDQVSKNLIDWFDSHDKLEKWVNVANLFIEKNFYDVTSDFVKDDITKTRRKSELEILSIKRKLQRILELEFVSKDTELSRFISESIKDSEVKESTISEFVEKVCDNDNEDSLENKGRRRRKSSVSRENYEKKMMKNPLAEKTPWEILVFNNLNSMRELVQKDLENDSGNVKLLDILARINKTSNRINIHDVETLVNYVFNLKSPLDYIHLLPDITVLKSFTNNWDSIEKYQDGDFKIDKEEFKDIINLIEREFGEDMLNENGTSKKSSSNSKEEISNLNIKLKTLQTDYDFLNKKFEKNKNRLEEAENELVEEKELNVKNLERITKLNEESKQKLIDAKDEAYKDYKSKEQVMQLEISWKKEEKKLKEVLDVLGLKKIVSSTLKYLIENLTEEENGISRVRTLKDLFDSEKLLKIDIQQKKDQIVEQDKEIEELTEKVSSLKRNNSGEIRDYKSKADEYFSQVKNLESLNEVANKEKVRLEKELEKFQELFSKDEEEVDSDSDAESEVSEQVQSELEEDLNDSENDLVEEQEELIEQSIVDINS